MRGSPTSARTKPTTCGCGQSRPSSSYITTVRGPSHTTPALVTRRALWQNLGIPDCVQPCSHERPSTCVDFSKPGSIAAERPRARVGAAYSALVGWGATKSLPARLRPLAYRAFARAVGANLDEVELDLAGYPSVRYFFARKLRRGARVIDTAPGAIISPCDGVVAARGHAVAGALVQAKGRTYRLAELVADGELAAQLTGGAYATIYLSPRDYHRVHAPADAAVIGYDYLPGSLWSSTGALPQTKGRTYRLAELVADGELAAQLTGGAYATIYLSPRDYHRVHAPADAAVLGYDYLPGSLWSVNGALVQAKGRSYRLAELVADGELAAQLTGGAYATIYLSPRDY